MRDPLHVVTYVAFIMLSCAFFSKLWIEISGDTPKDRVKQLREGDMAIVGYRDRSMVTVLVVLILDFRIVKTYSCGSYVGRYVCWTLDHCG